MSNLSKEFKKAATAAYKEKKTIAGIYAIHCKVFDKHWVGKAPDLATIWNRLTFELRFGNCRCQSLQQDWTSYGCDSFTFKEIERIDVAELSFAGERVMRERLEYWCSALSAHPI